MTRINTNLRLCAKLVIAMTAFSVAAAVSAQELDTSETITIGIGNEPPYTELKPDGTLSGAGPDVDRAALRNAGFTDFEGTVMPYGAMIPALMANRIRMLSAGSLIITPERCEQVIFAEPVICNADAFLTRADAPNFDSYAEAATLGLTLAVGGGTLQQRRAVEAGVPQQNLVVYPDSVSAVQMLQNKRVDAIVLNDAGVLEMKERSGDDTLRAIMPISDAPIGCATASFAKSDTVLRDAYDAGLLELKKSGELDRIMMSYGLEANLQLLASAPSMAEFCAQ